MLQSFGYFHCDVNIIPKVDLAFSQGWLGAEFETISVIMILVIPDKPWGNLFQSNTISPIELVTWTYRYQFDQLNFSVKHPIPLYTPWVQLGQFHKVCSQCYHSAITLVVSSFAFNDIKSSFSHSHAKIHGETIERNSCFSWKAKKLSCSITHCDNKQEFLNEANC